MKDPAFEDEISIRVHGRCSLGGWMVYHMPKEGGLRCVGSRITSRKLTTSAWPPEIEEPSTFKSTGGDSCTALRLLQPQASQTYRAHIKPRLLPPRAGLVCTKSKPVSPPREPSSIHRRLRATWLVGCEIVHCRTRFHCETAPLGGSGSRIVDCASRRKKRF